MEKENIIKAHTPLACCYTELTLYPKKSYRQLHFHEETEVIFVNKGEIMCDLNGKEIRLPEKSVTIIASRVPHCLKSLNEPSNITYIQADINSHVEALFPNYSLFACFMNKNVKNYAVLSSQSDAGVIFNDIYDELKKEQKYYDIAVRGCIYRLVAVMCREGMLNPSTEISKDKSFEKILPALIWAKENFSRKLTLDELCEHIHTDKYNFCKQFKKSTGITFFNYLGYLRLKKAEELLISTGKSISETAFDCGFCSLQYFNRFFSEQTGYSPSTYRKLNGEK